MAPGPSSEGRLAEGVGFEPTTDDERPLPPKVVP